MKEDGGKLLDEGGLDLGGGGLTVGFIEKTRCVTRGAENTAYSRHQSAKAGKQPRATQKATGCVGGLTIEMMTFIEGGLDCRWA